MTEDIFRACAVKVDNTSVELKKHPIKDIFCMNMPPYVILGNSGKGKTTLCVDIIHAYAKECTNIYFITKTKETIKADDPIKQVPRAFRREMTLANLMAVWNNIKRSADDLKITSYKELLPTIKRLTNSQTATSIDDEIRRTMKIIEDKQTRYYEANGEPPEKAKTDAIAYSIEVITRLAVDMSKKYSSDNLKARDINLLQMLVSRESKTLLLIDDVTAELSTLMTSNSKVKYDGQSLKASAAYKALLTDILTRGRHANALTCMFLHSIDAISTKELVSNLVIMDANALDKIKQSRTLLPEAVHMATALMPYVAQHAYHFLYISGFSRDDGLSCCVGKADIHRDKIEFSEINQKYVEQYNAILNETDHESDNEDVDDVELFS